MCLNFRGGEAPKHGDLPTYYPNIMVEWYPHVLVISTIPRGPEKCSNVVEFYYPRKSHSSNPSS